MRHVRPTPAWPLSWRQSYAYDLEEVYDSPGRGGYAGAYRNRRHWTLLLLREALPAGARILDVAAAQGNFSLALAELGYEVTWNDLRAELVDYVRAKHEHGLISYAPGNAFDLEVGKPFDAVLIAEVIEHIAHPDDFLRKVKALVKPGGCIVMTTPNGAYFRNRLPRWSECTDASALEVRQFGPNAEDHLFLLHPDEIAGLASDAGLKVDRMVLFTNPLTNGHLKLEVLLQILPVRWVHALERAGSRLPPPLARRLMVHVAVRFRA